MSAALWDRLPGGRAEPRTVAACMPRKVPGGYMAVSGATATENGYMGYEYLFVETNHRYHALSLGAGTHGGDGDVYAWERIDHTENDGLDGVADAALRMGFGELLPDVIVIADDEQFAPESDDDYTGREFVKNPPEADVFEIMDYQHYAEVGASLPLDDGEASHNEQYLAMNGLPDVDLGRDIEVEVVGDVRDTVEGTVVQTAAESLVLDDGETARHVYDSHVAASEKGIPNLAEQAGGNGGGGKVSIADGLNIPDGDEVAGILERKTVVENLTENLDGVDERHAEALYDEGFENPKHLVAATQAEISEAEGVGNALAARIKAQVGGVGVGESNDPADDVLDAAMLGTYEGGTVEIDGAEFAATDVTFEWSAPTDERVGVGAEFVGDDDREFEVEVEVPEREFEELRTEAITEAVRAAAEQAAERARERAKERAVSLRE